jgi:hypothetical protein
MKKLTSILVVCLLLLATMPVSVMAEIVTPVTIIDKLNAGDTEKDLITVELPATSPKGDVIFLFDATGSMGGQIDAMKVKAAKIMTDVRASGTDSNFGVGSIVDYPHSYTAAENYGYSATYGTAGDYAWRMDQDLTSSAADVQTAINGIHALNGMDMPQDYARALYESQFYAWRSDAKKIVVIFGDAPPHMAPNGNTLPAPYSMSAMYGGDPGRDEKMNTADDLDFKTVVQSLKDNNIIVIAVDLSSGGDARKAFQYEADMTGGARYSYTASTIAEDIVDKINAETSAPIDTLTVKVREPAYAGWVTAIPTEYTNVPWGATKTFNIEITPPADTPTGTYTIHLDVLGDGVVLGTTTVTKDITGTTPAPEFPSLALPIGMILGMMFIVHSIRKKD